jgi:hypothetical protein
MMIRVNVKLLLITRVNIVYYRANINEAKLMCKRTNGALKSFVFSLYLSHRPTHAIIF